MDEERRGRIKLIDQIISNSKTDILSKYEEAQETEEYCHDEDKQMLNAIAALNRKVDLVPRTAEEAGGKAEYLENLVRMNSQNEVKRAAEGRMFGQELAFTKALAFVIAVTRIAKSAGTSAELVSSNLMNSAEKYLDGFEAEQ